MELLKLSLGQDERLNVVRTEKPKLSQDVFLKNERRESRALEIRVINTSSEKVNVLVKDHVPVSTDKAIELDIIKLSEAEYDKESGEMSWKYEAEPSELKFFELEYRLSWPKDKRLNERRVYK